MQSCTSFLRGFSSRLRVEDSETSYLDMCIRREPATKDHTEDRHTRELTMKFVRLLVKEHLVKLWKS